MKVKITKVTRRSEPEYDAPPMIRDGDGVVGDFLVPTIIGRGFMDMKEEERVIPEGTTINDIYELAETFAPIIGYPVYVRGNKNAWDWLRTSCIRSYYIHETDGSAPDKLVLPTGFPVEDVSLNLLSHLKKGDMLLATMNSIYWVTPL